MELLKEILVKILGRENVNVTISNIKLNFSELFNNECYIALEKIKAVLEDNSLDDRECFIKIEEIVCIFEELGSSCGDRHDY